MSVFFKGREIMHQDLGQNIIQKFISDVGLYGNPDGEPSKSGKTITVVINPK